MANQFNTDKSDLVQVPRRLVTTLIFLMNELGIDSCYFEDESVALLGEAFTARRIDMARAAADVTDIQDGIGSVSIPASSALATLLCLEVLSDLVSSNATNAWNHSDLAARNHLQRVKFLELHFDDFVEQRLQDIDAWIRHLDQMTAEIMARQS